MKDSILYCDQCDQTFKVQFADGMVHFKPVFEWVIGGEDIPKFIKWKKCTGKIIAYVPRVVAEIAIIQARNR